MSAEMSPLARSLFESHREQIVRRTDRWFAVLMICQFIAGIAFALVISPRAWTGTESTVHPHVWVAVVLGGAIAAMPVVLASLLPGHVVTRFVIASAQMLMSSLLIHLTGGRIETHFHVFGSLAFLAFYRDWRVFIPATAVVAVDHLIRGMFWPESVYGVISATPWRSVEHAAWVIFEDIFLIRSCIQGVREMKEIAMRRADLEQTNAIIEERVVQRTAELTEKSLALELEIGKREEMHRRLLEVSRQAGMAEVATGVLHNVGNVLNSVNVAAEVLSERVKKSPINDLAAVSAMIRQQTDLAAFFTENQKGCLIPKFLEEFSAHLASEQTASLNDLEELTKSIDHIRDIVTVQQSYARVAGAAERVDLRELVEDAIRINGAALQRHGVTIIRELQDVEPTTLEKQKVLQILVNLISNAKYAMDGVAPDQRWMKLCLCVDPHDSHQAQISVIDNGVGIPAENLTRIFSHGFTTRRDGHGFGLHSSAIAAKELGGSLRVSSDGPGAGATFVLELPLTSAEVMQ